MKDNIKEVFSIIIGIAIIVGVFWFVGDLFSNKEESSHTIIEVCGTEIATSDFTDGNYNIDGKKLGKAIEEDCALLYSELLHESYNECEYLFGEDYDNFKDCIHGKLLEKSK